MLSEEIKPADQLKLWFVEENSFALCKFFFDITLTPLQERIVYSVAFDTHKRIIINAMTRYGKSFCLSMGILLWILLNPNKTIAIVAPTNEKTSIIRNHITSFVSKSEYFMQLLDIEKKGFARIKKEVSRKRMTWKNGVEMRTLSAEGRGEALMGFGISGLLIIDESCDIDYEVYRSKVSRMLGDSPDSRSIEIGNPHHRENHFFSHFINPDWKKLHIGWQDALREGRISNSFLEEQKGELSEREFMILYESAFPLETTDALLAWEWIDKAVIK